MAQTLWGVKSGQSEMKPNWLTDAEKENTFATNAGWVLRQPTGIEETLVAVSNLKTKLGAATITEVRFGSGVFTAGTTRTVRVSYNEKVTVTGNPTLVVTGSVEGPITATYSSTSGQGNVLVFSFTVPDAPNTLSIGTQTIALAGGTIVETGVTPTVNAERLITAAVGAAAKTKTVVAAPV
jgi:hypothetical protein